MSIMLHHDDVVLCCFTGVVCFAKNESKVTSGFTFTVKLIMGIFVACNLAIVAILLIAFIVAAAGSIKTTDADIQNNYCDHHDNNHK